MERIFLNLFILSTIIIGASFVGCSSDDDPFAGKDNYITSFSLTKDGITYKAAISENKVKISVPNNVNLNGATVEYKISEQSSISPLPSSITEWEKSQNFAVTSYNKSNREYTYEVSHTDISEVGSVILLTQADVDKFAVSPIEIIDGSLIIGSGESITSADAISNLDALKSLKKVTNSVTILNTFVGKNLNGLQNLESAGAIYITQSAVKTNDEDVFEVEFPKLAEVGDFSLKSDIVQSVSLPKLKSAFSFYIRSQYLSTLDLPILETVITDFGIESGTSFTSTNSNTYNQEFKSISLPKLTNIRGSILLRGLATLEKIDTPKLESVGANFSVIQARGLESIVAPMLKEVRQELSLKGVKSLNKVSLPILTVAGSLIFNSDISIYPEKESMESLDLPKLEVVYNDLRISHFLLETLDLSSLKKVGQTLRIANGSVCKEIKSPLLEECKNIEFSSLPLILSLDVSKVKEIEKLEFVSCYKLALVKGANNIKNITLNGGSVLCDFPVFEGIESIPGLLDLTNYYQNDDFSFPGIKHIGKYNQTAGKSGVSVINFPDLETIDHLKFGSFLKKLNAPKLTEVKEWDTSFLQHVETGDLKLPKLKKIGTFKFYGATYEGAAKTMKLTSMNDFASVEEVEKVEIVWWGNMTDFSGMKNAIPNIEESDWMVKGCAYNPTYEQMKNGEWVKP